MTGTVFLGGRWWWNDGRLRGCGLLRPRSSSSYSKTYPNKSEKIFVKMRIAPRLIPFQAISHSNKKLSACMRITRMRIKMHKFCLT